MAATETAWSLTNAPTARAEQESDVSDDEMEAVEAVEQEPHLEASPDELEAAPEEEEDAPEEEAAPEETAPEEAAPEEEEAAPEEEAEPELTWEKYYDEDHGLIWWWCPQTDEARLTAPPGWSWCAETETVRYSRT
jgi:hypothetical protein